ncbi:MAG: chromosomal replication initiator protein DnaA [Lentisphaeria bacterium]|nr:chromosomal replication initiator protein DnaA [Lentisphaeria bacterium]
MKSVENIWREASNLLKSKLNEDTYETWIAGIRPILHAEGVFTIGVSSHMFSDWLASNYKGDIEEALETVLGAAIQLRIESGHESVASPDEPEGIFAPKAREEAPPPPPDTHATTWKLRVNSRCVFGSFVVGENTKMAHAACMAVTENPGTLYNPLFLYSRTGLGKTHLLQAVANKIHQSDPRKRIQYLTSEEFSNLFIEGLKSGTLSKFRELYRNVDVLLVDDVQFFTGKEKFQEEFFHTFNSLYNNHKQIVLASDQPPHEIEGLEKRLVSRFGQGMIADIQRPDYETRVAILRKKQEGHTIKIGDEVLSYIAKRIRSNIRDLEGALIRLVGYSSVTNTAVDKHMAENLLENLFEKENRPPPTVDFIQREVADYFDLRQADIIGKSRPKNIANARQIAMFFSRTKTSHSSTVIGTFFNRNHATVLHAVDTVKRKIGQDEEYRREVRALERRIENAGD